MKRKIIVIGSVVILLIVALFGASNFMLEYSLRPGADVPFSRESAWKGMFADYPDMESWRDSLMNIGALHDTTIVREDGVQLHAYYVSANQPTTKTAVVVHGYTDCAIRMFHIGRMYSRDLGYNILLPDLYYHGDSQGKAIQMGWKDRLDVMRWMKIAAEIFNTKSMVVHGISMGAATTMMVSGEEQPDYVKAFVDDCGYTSVWDEFKGELKNQFGLPSFPLLYTASWLCKVRFGWGFQEASALNQVKKCKHPMLFIHGDSDDYVPTAMVFPLYEAATCPKELWLTEGVAHALSYRSYPKEYTEKVRNFLKPYMK